MADEEGYRAIEEGQGAAPSPPAAAKWPISPPITGPWLSLLARTLGIASTALTIVWIQLYNGGVGFQAKELAAGGNDTGPIFCWHPILMMFAFAILMAEAVMSYQAPLVPGIPRTSRKRVHYILHSLAVVAFVLGIIAAFQSHNLKQPAPIPNVYSPHSYLGMATLGLLGLQFSLGYTAYVFPKLSLSNRMALGPIHRFLGMATWIAGLATCAVGFQDRASILQFTKANIYGAPLTQSQLKSPTLAIPASIEVLLLLLGMAVLYHLVPPASAQVETEGKGAGGEVEAAAGLKPGGPRPAGSGEVPRSRHD